MKVQDKDKEVNILEDLEIDPLEGAYNDGVPGSIDNEPEPDTKEDTSDATKDVKKDEEVDEDPDKGEQEQDTDPDKDKEDDQGKPDGEPEEEPEESIVRNIQQRIGIELPEGEELTDDEDGFVKLAKIAAQQMAEQHVDEYFGAFPQMKEFYEYLQYGGEPDKFLETRVPANDYSKVKLEEDNERQHEDIVRNHYKSLGYSADFIKEEIEDAKNGGTLENKAKRSLKALQTAQKQEQEGLVAKQKEQYEAQAKEVEEFWKGVTQTIDQSKEFKGISINEKDKSEFVNFLTKEVEPGKTARDAAVEKMTLEENLAIDYLLYKGFNLEDLINRKAKTASAKSFRERLKGGQKGTPKNSAESRKRPEAPDLENLDLHI